MRFSSISIKNYRQYRDLKLEFNRGENDLQVIVGDNGTGKTNLLNAFTWCLYGNEPHLGTQDKSEGEPRLNKDVIAELVEQGSLLEDVAVTIELEDGDELIRVHRRLPVRVVGPTDVIEKKAEEYFSVVRISPDGKSQVVSPEYAEAFINRLLPESIREYFFFDGEQLGNYFSGTRTGAIRSAVHSISQIDDVSRMRSRTDATVKTLMRALNKSLPNLTQYTDKIEKNQNIFDSYSKKVQKLDEDARSLRLTVEELDEKLRGIPDIEELEKNREILRGRLKTRREALESARRRYYRFARESYVDFSFYEVASSALEAISAMEKEKQLPPAIDNDYLESMLIAHKCEVCNRPLNKDEESHIKELLERFRVSSETSNVLTGMRSELKGLVDRVKKYPQERDEIVGAMKLAEQAYNDTEAELEDVERRIANCPNAPQVKAMFNERDRCEKKIKDINQEIGSCKRTVDLAARVVEKTRREYNEALRKQGKFEEDRDAVDFGQRAVKILERVEKEVIDETRRLMAAETEQLFKGLVWKDNKCDHVELGKSYQLALYDKAGFTCAGTCSAAERALLALSFTLAMHEVSGFESPLFIDTPIARASGDNRANFAKTLAEVSKGKQLILTFTPDEYSEAIASVFDPIAATHLKLVLDTDERVVSVKGAQ